MGIRAGLRKDNSSGVIVLLFLALLSCLWSFPCFTGTALQANGSRSQARAGLSRAACVIEHDTSSSQASQELDVDDVLQSYLEGEHQSEPCHEFEAQIWWKESLEEFFANNNVQQTVNLENRKSPLLSKSTVMLEVLLSRCGLYSKSVEPAPRPRRGGHRRERPPERRPGGRRGVPKRWEAEELLEREEFRALVNFQIEKLEQLNKFLPADILIQNFEIGNSLQRMGMVPEGPQMANTALNAIESALKPEVLFAGPYGFSAIDLPNILASSAGGHEPIFRSCISGIRQSGLRCGPKALLKLVTSMVPRKDKMEAEERELLRDTLRRTTYEIEHLFDSDQLATMLYNSVLLDLYDEELLQLTTRRAATNIGLFNKQELGRLAFSVTRSDFRDQNFLGSLAQATTWRAADMPGSVLSSILQCFGHFGFVENELAIQDAAKQIQVLLTRPKKKTISAAALSGSLKGLAQLQYKMDGDLLEMSALRLVQYARDISGLLQKQQQPEGVGVEKIRGNIETISSAIAALAALGYRNADFMEAVSELLSKHSDMFTFRSLANVLWSLAALRGGPDLTDVIAASAVQLPKPLPEDLVKMAWAFARLGKPNPDFLHLLREQADADMSRFPERLLPDLAWSLVKLEAAEDDTMQKLADEAQQVTRLDGVSWMTLILSLNHANVKPRQIDKLVRNCAASLKGKIKSQTESSLLALHWLLRSVKRTKGIASFRKDIDIEISNRGLDSLDLSTMFTQEGAFLQLLPSESATFAAT